jgi:hypothetical protein
MNKSSLRYNVGLALLVFSIYCILISAVLITWEDMHPSDSTAIAAAAPQGLPEFEGIYTIVEILE